MSDGDGLGLLALPPAVAEGSIPTLEDVGDYFDPDGVWVLGPDRRPRAVARARQVFASPVVHPPLGDGGAIQRHDFGDIAVLSVQRGSVLERARDPLENAHQDIGNVVIVCDDVTTAVEPTALETRLEYASTLATLGDSPGRITVLTGGLPASYDETWYLERSSGECLSVRHTDMFDSNSLGLGTDRGPHSNGSDQDHTRDSNPPIRARIHGMGTVEGYGSAKSVSCFTIGNDSTSSADRSSAGALAIDVETLDADAFGIEAVTGIGPKTADRLADNGITTRTELLEMSQKQLSSLPGIGRSAATTMHQHATVLERGQPRRVTEDPLPGEFGGAEPLCLDIETDGLSPTIIWQIGVYDPETDEYREFVERSNPTDPGPILERFCTWLLGTCPDRTLCTWNGRRFDYRHLNSFVDRHVSHYSEEWRAVTKFDLYHWAVTEQNAVLPGRTNTLEDVSRALGYRSAETGLDGATTARAYQRFIRTGVELDWDRHEAYCEDDCRALWHVYDRLRKAEHDGRSEEPGQQRTRTDRTRNAAVQANLGEF